MGHPNGQFCSFDKHDADFEPGSGKTGLCLSLLEEAALDGVPAICIDPKGDLGNLLLTFPDLLPADFEPWIEALVRIQDEPGDNHPSPFFGRRARAALNAE